MGRYGAEEKERLAGLKLPDTQATRSAMREYMGRAGFSHGEFGERVNYSQATVKAFLNGSYETISGSDAHFREAVWDYMRRYPIAPTVRSEGFLYPTKNVSILSSNFEAVVEHSEVALAYGPPGTQKTFTLEHLIAARNRAKQCDVFYVYAAFEMTPLSLAREIAREVGIYAGTRSKDRCVQNVIDWLRRQPKPPALVIDEAQHLTIGALETVRQIHDRGGCGVLLAGSHDLYEKFLKARTHLEQWLSRIDYKEPLPGLLENEVREIAARELGNGHPAKLTEKQVQMLVSASRVDDVFARGADGRLAPQKYLSVRRLVKTLRQLKAAKEKAN
jgi:DNA transposition AAA+ family ATPase